MRLARRRDGEAAVAAEHRGHAVQRRRAGRRVPGELGVVVGVEVDEAGRHHQAGGVDLGRAGLELVDRDDAAVAHGDVADRTGRAGAVDHEAAADQAAGQRNSSSAFCVGDLLDHRRAAGGRSCRARRSACRARWSRRGGSRPRAARGRARSGRARRRGCWDRRSSRTRTGRPAPRSGGGGRSRRRRRSRSRSGRGRSRRGRRACSPSPTPPSDMAMRRPGSGCTRRTRASRPPPRRRSPRTAWAAARRAGRRRAAAPTTTSRCGGTPPCSVSSQAASSGSQWPVWSDGRPSLAGISAKLSARKPALGVGAHEVGGHLRVAQPGDLRGDDAPGVGAGPHLVVPVVPRVDAGQAELGVLRLREHRAAEPGDERREAHRRADAGQVHVGDAGVDVPAAAAHLVEVGRRHRPLVAGPADHRVEADVRVDVALVGPHLAAVVAGDDLRRPVGQRRTASAPRRGRAAR